MKPLRNLSLIGSALALLAAAAPVAAQDAWHRYSAPEGIGSFEVPCGAESIDLQAAPTGDGVMCEAGGLSYNAAIVSVRDVAPDDLSVRQLDRYNFEAFEADAASDPEMTDFLAVEAGGMPGFYVASIDNIPLSRLLAHDVGDGRVLILLAMSDVIEGTAEGDALGKLADRFLISFKVTPQ